MCGGETGSGASAGVKTTMKTEAFDHYLAQCVRSFVRSDLAPEWPNDLEIDTRAAATRITFHGVALLLVEAAQGLPGWPSALAELVNDEARSQSFWELSHQRIMARLTDSLHQAGIEAYILKGTALAYSVYPKPALRRRGDSDLLISGTDREKARAVFRACGFTRWSDVRPLQECWQSPPELGFNHSIDLHWRVSASPAVSQLLEANQADRQVVALPQLGPNAVGLSAIENLLLICINRAAHGRFGYLVGDTMLFENDRLIWALDIHLITATFSESDWGKLATRAAESGSSDIVLSGLQLARSSMGTIIPDTVLKTLETQSADKRLSHYLARASGRERFLLDLAASPNLSEKTRLVVLKLFPGKELLHERYPDATHWPTLALRLRRLFSGVGNFVKGRA